MLALGIRADGGDCSREQRRAPTGTRARSASSSSRAWRRWRRTSATSPSGFFLFGTPLFLAVISGILFAVFNAALGGDATFKQVFAVVVHTPADLGCSASSSPRRSTTRAAR